ncbi:MAG: FecR domain-containing protein [Candidatus Riflebacteria bacterium]|nr:FecR domain-containing protein [Candidatus Riflebacteria bacterium]
MKRFFLFLVMLCFLCPVFADDSGVRFSTLNGEVQLFPDGNEDAKKFAKLQTVISVNDHVETGEDSTAILSFADMSTFLLKAESEIIIATPPDQDSKVDLVKGKIWVNVKKMAAGGTMEVKMSQAVAGIKGTNITCETNKSRTEDRLTVLRGIASIIINETRETMTIKEGESVVVKTGGKTEKQEIDLQKANDEWKEDLSKMGDSIELNEIPDTIRQIQQNLGEKFKGIKDSFSALAAATAPTEDDVQGFKKDAERLAGTLMEDSLIINSMQGKVDKLLAAGNLPASKKALCSNYMKMITDVKKALQGVQSELGKMMKYNFKKAATTQQETVALGLDDVPDAVSQIQNRHGEAFKSIQDTFKTLSASDNVKTEDSASFQKDCERFVESVGEDMKALSVLQTRIDSAREKAGLTADQKSQVSAYSKLVTDARKVLQGFQSEVAKFAKSTFKKASSSGTSSEITDLSSRVAATWGEFERISRELQGSGGGGLTQSWFTDAIDSGNNALKELSEQASEVQTYLDANSSDKAAQDLVKTISSYQSQISKLLRDLAVVPVEPAVLTEMQQIDDVLSASIVNLRAEIDSYNSSMSSAQPEVRLRNSLSILNNFSKSKRMFNNAQRLYESLMKKAAGQKYATAEQEELKNSYNRIVDTYQQLGLAAEELQTQLKDLESQLGRFIK